MKKLIAVLLVLMMLPLGAASGEESVSGTWYFTLLTVDDYSVNSTDAGLDMMLVLNEDGTASSTTVSGLSRKETSGTWNLNGETLSIILDGEERTGVVTDGQIVLGNAGSGEKVLTFSRTALMGVYYTPAAPKNASISEYIGVWTCRYAALGTRIVAMSALDNAAEITVTRTMAQVYIRNTADDERSASLLVSLDDGMLCLGTDDVPDYTLQLLEDGVAVCQFDTGVTYYMERTVE